MSVCATLAVASITTTSNCDNPSSSGLYFSTLSRVSHSQVPAHLLQLRTSLLPSCKDLLRCDKPLKCAKTASWRLHPLTASLQALVFDCDGVILESEDLHRRAYNAAFNHFNVVCTGSSQALEWSSHFYDQLQNQIGGGKPKMRWYFKTYGWPSSTIFASAPENDADRDMLIDMLQDWKTEKYKDIIASGSVDPRPGVLELMDEAQAKGLKVAVCSAATKSSVIFCLNNLLGENRIEQLDCFLAGDDVQKKKPDPSIYVEAAKRLAVSAEQCLVIEDSVIGLQAAVGAGMNCIISYTSSTAEQDFTGACGVYADLENVRLQHLQELMEKKVLLK
ncbi:hypothetical protein L7F22_040357 [Adiantum nelumboides]|nr:hypothetical protein [Adiantum nelumboides]